MEDPPFKSAPRLESKNFEQRCREQDAISQAGAFRILRSGFDAFGHVVVFEQDQVTGARIGERVIPQK